MSTRPVALPEPDAEDEPVDLVALQADDELINALASGLAVSAGDARGPDADDKLSAILAAWKAEVDAEPIPELVDLDTAVATVHAARRPSGRARHLVPVAAAAAILVMLLGGVSLGSYSAEPDDVLWPVAKVLYSERTDSVLAAGRVEERIALAKQAFIEGKPAVVEELLQANVADLRAVRPEEGQDELLEVQDFLEAKADEALPSDPGAPLAADPAREVPPGAEIDSPARTSEQSSPADPPSEEPGSSTSTGVDSEQSEPVDPRILPAPAPAPAPAVQPEVSTAPAAGDPPAAENPAPGESSVTPPPVPPEPQPEPAPPGVVGGASAPEPAPAGTQSIGATAADTSTTAPSPTS